MTITKENAVRRNELVLLLTGFIILLIAQLALTIPLFIDEDDYLSNVSLLHQYGFGRNYLIHLKGSAGPLYSMLHFLLEPLTGLKIPWVRTVNMCLLAGAAYFIYSTISIFNFKHRFYALFVMAIPMTYTIGGFAFTETPALFFYSIAVYLLIKNTYSGQTRYSQLILAGVCMSLSVIGRQPYLLSLLAVPVLFVGNKQVANKSLSLIITFVFALLLPCYVFYQWGGLTPPIEGQLYRDIEQSGIAYRLDFFVMCVGYYTMAMVLIAPSFFRMNYNVKKIMVFIICFLTMAAINFHYQLVEWLPLKTILDKIFASSYQRSFFTNLSGSIFLFSCVLFLICIWRQLRRMHFPREAVFFALTLLLTAFACIKITWGFSSRYAAQGIPSLILLGSFFYKRSAGNIIFLLIGVVMGLTAFISFFVATP